MPPRCEALNDKRQLSAENCVRTCPLPSSSLFPILRTIIFFYECVAPDF